MGPCQARLDVLEEAWSLRSSTLAQHADASIARVYADILMSLFWGKEKEMLRIYCT